jgi:hypothetical protein
MTTLLICPHCGKPMAKSAGDLSPKDLALLQLVVSMSTPDVGIDALISAKGNSTENSFDRRLSRLRKLALIDRRLGRVWATDAGRTLVGARQARLS